MGDKMKIYSFAIFIVNIIFAPVASGYLNFSCALSLCEKFNIKTLELMDYSNGINTGYQQLLVLDYLEIFSQRGIRVRELQVRNEPEKLQIRSMHALNAAYLLYNIDPGTKIKTLLVQDHLGTSPSLFIFSLVAVRGGLTAAETIQYTLSRVDLRFDSRAFATFQSSPGKLYEVYRLSNSHPITVNAVEMFSQEADGKHLPLKAKTIPKILRNNLKGLKITAVAAPLTDMEEGYDDWTKAYILIWQNIAENLNFSFQVKPTGRAALPEASWEHMMDAVSRGVVDLSLSPVIMLPSTVEKVEFSAPVHRVTFSVLMKATASARIRWNNFLLPFHSSLWFSILAAILLMTTLLTFFWKAEYERHHNAHVNLIDLFSESLICIHGAACMQGHPEPPLSSSARFIHFSALVSAIIVMATYSGSFTAFLTVRSEEIPFSTLNEFIKSSRFRPYTLQNSPEHSFFEESQHTSMIEFREKGAPSTAPDLESALKIICNKNSTLPAPWSKRIPAFVVPTIWVERYLDLAPCSLAEYPLTMQAFAMAFPMKAKIPYKRIFDNRVKKIVEGGAINKFEVDIKRNARIRRESKDFHENGGQSDSFFSMTILEFAPLGALLGIAAGASLFTLVVECVVFYLN